MSTSYPAGPIKTEKPDHSDEDSSIRVGETFSIKDEPFDEEEAVDPLDEDSYVPDIDVSQFLQQDIVTVTSRSSEFDKRIFPQKGKRAYESLSPVVTTERKLIRQIRNYNKSDHQKQKSSQTAKRARKVALERERRAELTQLYDRLQYWTEGDDAELSG